MLVHNLMDFSEMGRDLPDIVKEEVVICQLSHQVNLVHCMEIRKHLSAADCSF